MVNTIITGTEYIVNTWLILTIITGTERIFNTIITSTEYMVNTGRGRRAPNPTTWMITASVLGTLKRT